MNIINDVENRNKIRQPDDPDNKFWVRLKLLLWKNWLLRKRNKFRSITEIIWPLIMILFVVLLHKLGEKYVLPNCYMKARAMPTAGEVLFLQTFFCAANNTCDTERNASMSCYNSSIVSNLGGALQEAFNLTTEAKWNSGSDRAEKNGEFSSMEKKWVKDYLVIEGLIESIKKQNDELTPTDEQFSNNFSTSYTCNFVEYSFFNELREGFPNMRRNEILDDIDMLSRVKRKIYLAGILNSIYQFFVGATHKEGLKQKTLLDELKILDYILCGPNVPSIMAQVSSLMDSGRKKNRESENDVQPEESSYIVEEFERENDTTEFCNQLMEKMESTYSSRVVFRLFKPLIRGKLIYTPNAPVVNRIMQRINETLSHVKILIDLIRNATMSPEIDGWKLEDVINKYKNEESFLREIMKTKLGNAFFNQFQNRSNYGSDPEQMKQLERILDETIENWKNLMNGSNGNFANFSNLIPYLECFDLNRLIPVSNEEVAVKEALKWLNQERLWGLIVFVDVPEDAEKLPTSVTYKIRTGIERTPVTNQLRERVYVPRVRRNVIYDLREITGGFAYLQNLVEGELIRELTGRENIPGIYLQQTPYPCHIYDTFTDVITRTFPMFMVISWIYIFCMISKRIVTEKEILFKGTLRIFGVTATQHWISWFIDAFVPMVFVTSILSILLVEGGLIPNSSIFLVWLFLTTFILPTITLAFLVSTFFFKASFAMAVSGMIYFLLYLPYPPIQNFGEIINPTFKIFACLISNVAFGLGCTWIANMEQIGTGAQLDKINFSPVPGNPITMSLIIEMFLIDSLIYLLLAIYFDNVFAASDSVKQPWYYCFTMPYRRRTAERKSVPRDTIKPEERNPQYFEPEPEGLQVGIEVVNLTKEFGRGKKKKRAVNNLTINFYEDQITSFLGHNGAGKTTAISMMIGLVPITEGSVRIYGVDIKNNLDVAIKNVGICRQENVLLDDLTVEEHFILFSRLKNRSAAEVDNDMKQLIRDLQLGHRAKQPVKILSGGMKRKVCVAMAFIGGSRTVFLDEPTAGIDPYSRRSIWELLVKYKKGRTIILTTHFLDEADLLGDRIAIISSGELQCCSSSIFLKSQLGRGYYLTIENTARSYNVGRRAKGLETDPVRSAQVQELDNLIKKVIPGAEFSEEVGSEIVFILPAQIMADDYNALFMELENSKERLNISSYGITDTSLEEVFMRVVIEAEGKAQRKRKEKHRETPETTMVTAEAEGINMSERNEFQMQGKNAENRMLDMSKRKMFKEHFIALLIKRFLHHRRNYKIVLIEIFLPTLFMAIALALARTLPKVSEMPPLLIDMSAYSPSKIFYTNNMPGNSNLSAYEDALLGPHGLGTKCVLFPEECSMKSIPKGSLISEQKVEVSGKYSCTNGIFDLDSDIVKPPNAEMSSGDTLYNLTGLNLTHWLISTELAYSPYRYGGISFGHFNSFTGMSATQFLNLFMFEKFIKILEKFVVNDVFIDPEMFTWFVMSLSCNKPYGDELLSGKDLSDNIIIWYNNRGWIANLAMMNGVTNIVLRASVPNGSDPSKYAISLVNHPLPITKRQLEDQIELQTNIALLCSLSVIWALSFIPATYAVYLVEERVSGLKHLQIVSGISRIVYWFTNFIWDIMAYSISIAAIIFLYFLFQLNAFIGNDTIGTFVALLYSYGCVNITFVYVISFFFNIPSTAFIFIACYNILVGVATLLCTFTLSFISSRENPYYLNTIFMIFPQYCFGKCLINMALEGIRSQSLENFGIKQVSNSFAWHLTMKYIVVMLIIGMAFFVLTLLIEYQIFQRFFYDKLIRKFSESKVKSRWGGGKVADGGGGGGEKKVDEDVKNEVERVESGRAKKDGDVLIINNLTKIYSRKESPAVDHICVGIKKGECFGLLGLNGAGKTTVFKMLTGYISPSEGDATIGGYSITKDPRQAKLLVGYCPQVNALDPYLTPKEHLSFFCRIRGVSGEKRKNEISLNLERLGLTEYKNKIVKVLSGGYKRKVNTAIALICNPELVLLDEPTSGMDVLSRRFLWNCLQDVVLEGRCVVLTSHSMEECQALCTHLSIMVNGRFSCFGSSQHLKNKFNEGYSVTVRLFHPDKVQDVMNYFEKNLPDSTLIHVHYLQIKFKLNPQIFIGTVFTILSNAKNEKLIQDYSISQTTLESVFLKLATSAENAKGPRSKYGYLKNLYYGCCGRRRDE